MKKSLFRNIDRFELIFCYVLCFAFSIAFDYSRRINIGSDYLRSFLEQFYEHQGAITMLFSLVIVVFHCRMIQSRKTEVRCRILVGDTIRAVTARYFCECLVMSGGAFAAALITALAVRTSVLHIVCLFGIMVLYILISSGMVRRFENI